MDYTLGFAELYYKLTSHKDYKLEIKRLNSLLIDLVIDKNNSHLLSIGCGTGSHELLLAKDNYKITAIDLSKEMIKQAKKKIHFIILYLETIPLKS